MALKITINSDNSYAEGIERIHALYQKKKFLRISIVAGIDRSGQQNDMVYHLYELIAEWFHGGDIDLARAECKLTLGLPVLRQGSPDLDVLCTKTIDRLDYDGQLQFIKTMDISSLMSMDQARKYITLILDTYAMNGIIWPSYLTKEKDKKTNQGGKYETRTTDGNDGSHADENDPDQR